MAALDTARFPAQLHGYDDQTNLFAHSTGIEACLGRWCCSVPLLQVSDRLRQTVRTNQQYVNPGANFMLLNGMLVEVKNFELFSE